MRRAGNEGPPLALTMGEPAGIGGEIALKAWRRREGPIFIAIDDAERLTAISGRLRLGVAVRPIARPEDAAAVFDSALPVIHRPLLAPAVAGRPDPANAGAVVAAIETAVGLAREGRVAAAATNPIQKDCLYAAGFRFPGHTEFLAHLAGIATPPIMMLACPTLRVVPVTIHVSLRRAIAELTTDAIIAAATITARGLVSDFGIATPRLAIAGLNPHAGEGGAMGDEERTVIAPAIARLRADGIDAFGPLSPDTLFAERTRRRYDAAICMYHDQALIPIKTIDFDHAVNVTLGLPFVRTSPDHGTALDIAGSGRADETSLIAALELASTMAVRRRAIAGAMGS